MEEGQIRGGILLALHGERNVTRRRDAIAMFSRVRIAIRFFFVGLAVGVLLAPRSGEETRRLVREKADRLLNDILDAASLGTVNTGTTASPPSAPRETSGSGAANGGRNRSGSRSRASRSAADEETGEEADATSPTSATSAGSGRTATSSGS